MPAPLRLCLVGEGIGLSPTPVMQRAAIAASGREGSCEHVDVPPSRLPSVVRELRSGRWRGANVTIPYKHALAAVCDRLEGDAALCGAVNTIVVEPDGTLTGANTDAVGFELGLSAHHLWPHPGGAAVVLGAGGAAAAALLALSRVPVARVLVASRRIAAARRLVDSLRGQIDVPLAVALWDADYLLPQLSRATIVVNATPAPLADLPVDPAQLPPSCTFADMRYRPRPVDTVVAATAAGLPACDGLEMLLHQGMLSFERWTGDHPPYGAARRALEQAVGQ